MSRVAAACAAFAAVAAGTAPAAAQDDDTGDTVVIEGRVWFDRNANGKRDEGEPPLANGRAIRVSDVATRLDIGVFGTDAEGRYRAVVPDVPVMVYNHNADVFEPTTRYPSQPVVGGGTFDFGLRGADVPVLCWVEDDDPTDSAGTTPPGGCPVRIAGGPFEVDLAVGRQPVNGTYFFHDLPAGRYTITAGTLFEHGLALVRPTHENDVDWATYTREIEIDHSLSGPWVEVAYDEARGDMSYALRLEPGRDRYEVGDEFEAVVSVTNEGTVPERATFVIGEPHDKVETLSVSANATTDAPGGNAYVLKDRLLPGATAEVRVKARITAPFSRVDVSGRAVNELRDADFGNNVVGVQVLVGGGTSTTSTTPTTSTTTTAPTTTGSPAVPVAGDGGDLADTGAAPFPLFALGGLLLGGGALALVAARRRRRA
ncbi:LPXTG cell wall anchor domain-containing protein [Saccharothrix xinjiangensis]|uniref:LPXTG cell wall anchor domain-containing protein n=1 Tax=Saccharothrix xinjiangensis TaxID=204798 RepID=A0ABV9Y376_9PSEU